MSGVATNVCVDSTARHGFMKDYYIVLLKDCTATVFEELHNTTLKNIALYFGEVVDSSNVLECWRQSVDGSKMGLFSLASTTEL